MTGYSGVQEKLKADQCVILDGAMATELQAMGAREFQLSDADHWGFEALHHSPDAVASVHRAYVDAGCDIVTTNTYGILDAPKARAVGGQNSEPLHWIELARRSMGLARGAIQDAGRTGECAVAFSIGGDVLTADHLLTIKLLLRTFRTTAPDLVVFETLSMMHDDLTREAIALVLAEDIPVWLSFRRCRGGVCGVHGQLWGGPEGDYFGRLAIEMEQLGVSALLINCLPTFRVTGTLPWLADFTDLPLGVYPNLGRYVDPEWRLDEDVGPDDYAEMGRYWRSEGARIIGGCCGVRPAHIAALAEAMAAYDQRPSDRAQVSAPGKEAAAAPIQPWVDDSERTIFPLPLPELHCDPGVFVPTQGSYLAWKYLFNHQVGKAKRCLDIGCGAGLLSIQLALNEATVVDAIDINEAAVANTLTNAFRNGVEKTVHGRVVDLYALQHSERYDVVVASLYQMPTDPKGQLSGHRPVDYWGRNLLDHCISLLPKLLSENGRAYVMQISLLGQQESERLFRAAGFSTRVLDYSLFQFKPVFLENLEQIERVERESDAYHFSYGKESHVMVMYLIEAQRMEHTDG